MTLLLFCVLLANPSTATSPSTVTAPVVRPTPTAPAPRPLDVYPAFVRPFLKYGVGGAVVGWFAFGLVALCRQRWRAARSPEQKRLARRWIAGMLLGLVVALALLAVGFVLSLRERQLDLLFWCAAPLAVILPPALAALATRWPRSDKRNLSTPRG